MTEFRQLKTNLKKDFAGLKLVRVAVLGDSATQLFCQAVRGHGYDAGLDLEIYEAGYDQIEREVHDPGSPLHRASADFVILLHSVQKLQKQFASLPPDERSGFASTHLTKIEGLWNALEGAGLRVLQFNTPEVDDGVFGQFANKLEASFLYQARRINLGLMDLARRHGNAFIVDAAALQACAGAERAFSPQLYVTADMTFALDFLPELAKAAVDIICAVLGNVRKCLIFDLDNTLWGGVIGDDGLEGIQIGDLGVGKAFTDLQAWGRQLRERGILLAVCSKNEDAVAREVFAKHPDMVLRLEDFAVFVANWRDKPDNVRHIQSILNISFDSMVFVDDSPFEREMVRNALPEVVVPELPADPAEYLPFLRAQNLFETVSFSEEDRGRTRKYQEEEGRRVLQASFASSDDFLKSLEMRARVSPFDPFNAPRVAQLTQRSNQFNLRTVRYTEHDVQTMASSPDHFGFACSLRDRFGDYGLVSAIILRRTNDVLFIDTWVMSCRVLKRGLEQFVLGKLVECARRAGVRALVGEYLPTSKNGLVKDHFASLGFREVSGSWELPVGAYVQPQVFIDESAE